MSYNRRSRGVYAGLLATLGVTAALVTAPAAAYADEQVPTDGAGNTVIESDVLEQGNIAPGSNDLSTGSSASDDSEGSSIPDNSEPGTSVEDPEVESPETVVEDSQDESQQGGDQDGVFSEESSEVATDDASTSSNVISITQPQLSANSSVQSVTPAAGDSAPAEPGTAEGDPLPESGWLVELAADGSGLQRYYVKEGGERAQGLFKAMLSGVEGWFYAYGDGRVVRGRRTVTDEHGTSRTYLADNDGRLLSPGWHVTDGFGQGLQRYYVDADERACVEGYSSDGWGHYTRPEGYVVRGKWDTGAGTVVLADNDGRTAPGSGWLVTGAYDGGELQRYYLNGRGQALSSYFTVGTEKYFGLGGEGYVLRGAGYGVDGYRLFANNDGVLAKSEWVVTTALGNGLQRYWFDSQAHLAKGRFIETSEGSGWRAYALADGRILRGGTTVNGKKYFADNDGRIQTNQWVVTGAFTNGELQRYWATVDGSFKTSDGTFKRSDFFSDGGWLAYALPDGTIFRGKHDYGNGTVLLVDNDGRISNAAEGWLVTGIYDRGTLQRYYMNGDGTARSGFFTVDGKDYFGLGNQGYVLRGTTGWGDFVLLANNDGVMPGTEGWLVSDDYGQGMQRYMIDNISGFPEFYGALTGYFSVASDGTADTSGKDYYGRKEGYVVRGFYLIPGTDTLLYANNDGVLQPLTESPIVYNILKRIFWKSSQTQYLIGVDVENCWVVVFRGSAGNWNPLHVWRCVTGRPDKHYGLGTPRGDYMIGYDGADYNWSNSPSYVYSPGRYRTEYWRRSDVMYFTGFCLNLGFHSTKRVNGGFSDDGGQLGNRLSDGCIRLAVDNAKWIFDNCMPGTRVTTL